MKRTIIFAILLLLPISSLFAAEQSADKISLNLNSVEAADALNQLSQTAHISILADSGVKGKIACSLNNVTVDQTLNTICDMNKWEWVKVQVNADTTEKPSAAKLFTLVETVKQLGVSSIICDDPKTKARTVFIPSGNSETDTSALTSSLQLKTYYIIRVIPEPIKATETATENGANAATNNANQFTPTADVKVAATQVWNYMSQMSPDQQMQVMREIRQQAYESMTQEQRNAMMERFHRGGGDNNNTQNNRNHHNHNQDGQAPGQ